MPGPLPLLMLLTALLAGGDTSRPGLTRRSAPLRPPVAPLFQEETPARPLLLQEETPARPLLLQELVRPRRQSFPELVRPQPHLVHDMGRPEIHETKAEPSNSSHLNAAPSGGQEVAKTADLEVARTADLEVARTADLEVARTADLEDSVDVEDEMERMVHLAVLRDGDGFTGRTDAGDPETELRRGPGAAEASQEASGVYGTDMEERERGEDGGEDPFRREGEEEWERDEDRRRRDGDLNHTTPDLDALIGYTSSLNPSRDPGGSFPAEVQDSGLQEHRGPPVLEVSPLERELWEAQREEEEVQSSGYGLLHPSDSTSGATSAAAGNQGGTASPESHTGTDFGPLGGFTTGEIQDGETEGGEERGRGPAGVFTQNPTAPEVGLAPSRRPLQPSVEEEELDPGLLDLTGFGPEEKSGERKKGRWRPMEGEESGIRPLVPLTTDPSPTRDFTEPEPEPNLEEPRQVVCLNWSELAGRGYVILNMTQNMNCEEFRACMGVRLLKIIEQVFARRMNSPEGSWVLYLSKPTHQQHQLLMNVASGHGVIETRDVLDMLGEIRKSLNKVGIQNYSAASSCQSRPSKSRSDYGKLFVVLVIIGSVCMVIITSGVIYICWQRRLPSVKTMFRGEELHHVENGYHDNPTLDVTNDGQPEMQEKKPSANGLAGVGDGVKEDGSRWQVFVNQAVTEDEEEEQDTHL
ncbi:podocalyxin-like protein 2 [Cololabis saira]|uniref:podocalyxin-like protein 2 n=1 Tax=Cololabis saira TaxID=129043 RepID=UPI002AD23160|nr:podocalyxin-like protein 2 [Cololabis saira]